MKALAPTAAALALLAFVAAFIWFAVYLVQNGAMM